MIGYEEALKKIKELSNYFSTQTEIVDLLKAQGRILAEDIISQENIPLADNSAMDGFALKASETRLATQANPLRFTVQSTIAAGDALGSQSPDQIKSNTCVEIMTGALLPDTHYDSVVKVEDVQRQGNQIIVLAPVPAGNNVRPKGTDFAIGNCVLFKNTVLKDQHIMALAALGISTVIVKKKINVAVLSTGNEIVPYEQKVVSNSQVRNSSAPFLKVFLERNHCQVTLLGIQNDDPQSFLEIMSRLIKADYDIILTTGAVSMGKWDFIINTLPDLKMNMLFHKVAIRPGKPILLAQSEDLKTVLFGLPGNPISTAVGARFFVLPLIEKIMQIEPLEKWFPLQSDVVKPDGLKCFFKAVLSEDSNPTVRALTGQASYMIHSFLQSNCWVQLPAEGNVIKSGTKVRVVDL